ncbi:hypothetical protein GGI21_002790 [Coemansia aciculifera]|nr:hypothetical protein GGI21_002790 [Coemansia aciculifera]
MPAVAQVLSNDLLSLKSSDRVCIERAMTWDEVKQIVAADRVDLLGRTDEQERVYAEYMKEITQEHGSVVAFIKKTKLAPFIANSDTEYLIIPNDFPYALTPDMAHFIVWSKQKLTVGMVPDPAIQKLVGAHFDDLLGAGKYEWTWFVNPPHLQSIPEAAHGHLIVRTL